jgi:hypothetical protein
MQAAAVEAVTELVQQAAMVEVEPVVEDLVAVVPGLQIPAEVVEVTDPQHTTDQPVVPVS